MILQYDGTLSGFLCLLGHALKQRLPISRVVRGDQACSGALFAEERRIATDSVWAAKVAQGLEERLGRRFMVQLARALFSEEDGIEPDLIRLTGRTLREGRRILGNPADPLIDRVDRAALRTARERHRLLGLLRFERLADDSYLARCRPVTNCVPLLGGHFSARLDGQCWLILDERRRVAISGDRHGWQLSERVELSADLIRHATEQQTADLWRDFYRSVSNPDRYNPRLRRQFMPRQYWSCLTELQPGAEP